MRGGLNSMCLPTSPRGPVCICLQGTRMSTCKHIKRVQRTHHISLNPIIIELNMLTKCQHKVSGDAFENTKSCSLAAVSIFIFLTVVNFITFLLFFNRREVICFIYLKCCRNFLCLCISYCFMYVISIIPHSFMNVNLFVKLFNIFISIHWTRGICYL